MAHKQKTEFVLSTLSALIVILWFVSVNLSLWLIINDRIIYNIAGALVLFVALTFAITLVKQKIRN